MKKIIKILFVIRRAYVKLWSYINVGRYMRKYLKLLKKMGINIVGTPKFISPDVYFDGTDYSLISIGDNVTISREVMLLTHDYSLTNAMATLGKRIERGEGELYMLSSISIDDNSFIGARTSLLPGTHIGKNVIVGACSVVKGTIPDDSIVVGNPCKIIGSTKEYAMRHEQLKDYLIEM